MVYKIELWTQDYLKELIDLYCFESKQFRIVEDITLQTLGKFIEIILKNYQCYHISHSNILDLGDAFDDYLYNAFKDEFPDGPPNYPKTEKKALVLYVCLYMMQTASKWVILPEDVPFILKCLNIVDQEVVYMYEELDNYFEQFDHSKRYNVEIPSRWEVLNKQRKEAIDKGQPLPIRPMGIELDLCYKK